MPAQIHMEAPAASTELEIKSVLLVDDDKELAETLKELLEAYNFVVTVVGNGVEALHEVMSLDFDVIICDLMMPKMPGDMFYLAVQKTKPHLSRRFLFITGHADNPKVDGFLKSIDGLTMHKPVQTENLVRMIKRVLVRGQQDTAAE